MDELNRNQAVIYDLIQELIEVNILRVTDLDELCKLAKQNGLEYTRKQIVNFLYRIEKKGYVQQEKEIIRL